MYRISVKYQDKTFESNPLCANHPSMNLMELCHLPYTELSEVSLSINEYNEVAISITDKSSLVIERYHRKRHCIPNHPLVLFEDDILWIGDNQAYRFEIVRIQNLTFSAKKKKLSKNAILAGAAALVIASSAACNPTTKTDPSNDSVNSNTAVENVANPGDSAVPGEVLDDVDESKDSPQVMGGPEMGDPAPDDVDESKDHPQVMGEPPEMDEPLPSPGLGGDDVTKKNSTNDKKVGSDKKRPTKQPRMPRPEPPGIPAPMPNPKVIGRPVLVEKDKLELLE